MPILIVEGIDGSGKTTLTEALASILQYKYEVILKHKGPIESTVVKEYVAPLFDIQPHQLLIADRWHVGEMIYGPLYRGHGLVNTTNIEQIEEILNYLDAMRIILSPPIDVVESRLAARGEDFLCWRDVGIVHTFYESFANKFNWCIYRELDELDIYTIASEVR